MDTIKFHKSTGKELLAIKDRVRNLVNHWGEDGRHQEAVIKTMIQRFLPEKFKIGSGFVVRQTNHRGDHVPSRQIDLIIYDTSFPVLFKDNDFVILTPDSVLGIIEVKADVVNQGLQSVVKKANENGKFIFEGGTDKTRPIFNGIFSYESTLSNFNTVANHIKTPWDELESDPDRLNYCVNHISLNQDSFYKFWKEKDIRGEDPHILYELKELSFSFFISNLMDWITETSVFDNNYLWYPVDKSVRIKKEF